MTLLVCAALLGGDPALLCPGGGMTLRVRQVVPCDGLSRGERLLNGLPPLQPGDHVLAEVIDPPGRPPVLVGGTVTGLVPPGKFGRPGRVKLELAQYVDASGDEVAPLRFDLEDSRFTSAQRRRLTTALFVAEGFGAGAAVGAQLDRGRVGATLGGGAVGLLLGVAYAACQPGREASLEPGDVFRAEVGATCVRTLPPDVRLTVYPAKAAPLPGGKP